MGAAATSMLTVIKGHSVLTKDIPSVGQCRVNGAASAGSDPAYLAAHLDSHLLVLPHDKACHPLNGPTPFPCILLPHVY